MTYHDHKRLGSVRCGRELIWHVIHERRARRAERDAPNDENVAVMEEPRTTESWEVLYRLALLNLVVDPRLWCSTIVECIGLDLFGASGDYARALSSKDLGADPVENLTIEFIPSIN